MKYSKSNSRNIVVDVGKPPKNNYRNLKLLDGGYSDKSPTDFDIGDTSVYEGSAEFHYIGDKKDKIVDMGKQITSIHDDKIMISFNSETNKVYALNRVVSGKPEEIGDYAGETKDRVFVVDSSNGIAPVVFTIFKGKCMETTELHELRKYFPHLTD